MAIFQYFGSVTIATVLNCLAPLLTKFWNIKQIGDHEWVPNYDNDIELILSAKYGKY